MTFIRPSLRDEAAVPAGCEPGSVASGASASAGGSVASAASAAIPAESGAVLDGLADTSDAASDSSMSGTDSLPDVAPLSDADSLRDAAAYLGAARKLVSSAIPSGATEKWILAHYHEVMPLLRNQISTVLTVAALHGAMENPKHEFFGNDPVRWLAEQAKLSIKDVNELRGTAKLLYTPKTLVLPPGQSTLTPQKQSVIQRKLQAELRARLIELDINIHPLMTLCSTSDRLAENCKYRRLEVINNALDLAEEYTPDELKRLAAKEVNRINKEEKARTESLRQPSLVYQQADEFGFVSSYSYAPKQKQNQQEALLGDCQKALRRSFRQSGLEDPFAGQSQSKQRWLANDWTLKLGHEVLQRGLVTVDDQGDVRLRASAAAAGKFTATHSDSRGIHSDRSGSSATVSPVSRASLVVYARLEDLVGAGWRKKLARTNDGNTIALGDAMKLTPQGVDHLAVVDDNHEGIIYDIAADDTGELRPTRSVRTDQAVQQRFASRVQRLMLGLIQPYCAHPGCMIPAIKCQAHHLKAHKQGGETSIRNMALLCEYHHPRNDDSQSRDHQGHYAKDQDGIVFWQQHGTPLPACRYNSLNLPEPSGGRQLKTRNQSVGSHSRYRSRSGNSP